MKLTKHYDCPSCPLIFGSKSKLATHEKECHAQQNLPVEPSFQCSQCNRIFLKKCALRSHESSAHPATETSFQCNYCSETFKAKKGWTSHQRSHSADVTDFICLKCSGAFISQRSLKNHTKVCKWRNHFWKLNKSSSLVLLIFATIAVFKSSSISLCFRMWRM